MPVPSAITDLSTTLASNSPAGSDNVFPSLDDYLRAHAQFVALLRDGRGLSTEVSLASAATCDIGGAASMFVQITGTTTITSFGTNYLPRILRFAGALTLTHNATTLILPTGANITTAAGDMCLAVPVGTSGWRVLQYQRASEGADFVSFLPAGTGAQIRTVQSKLRDVVSVKDFGAVGDGVTDDTTAIQAAIDAAPYGTIMFPVGTYKITSAINIATDSSAGNTRRDRHITGYGAIISCDGGSQVSGFEFSAAGPWPATSFNLFVEGITFGGTASRGFISFNNAENFFENLLFEKINTTNLAVGPLFFFQNGTASNLGGVTIRKSSSGPNTTRFMVLKGSAAYGYFDNFTIEDCAHLGTGSMIVLDGSVATTSLQYSQLRRLFNAAVGTRGISGANQYLQNCVISNFYAEPKGTTYYSIEAELIECVVEDVVNTVASFAGKDVKILSSGVTKNSQIIDCKSWTGTVAKWESSTDYDVAITYPTNVSITGLMEGYMNKAVSYTRPHIYPVSGRQTRIGTTNTVSSYSFGTGAVGTTKTLYTFTNSSGGNTFDTTGEVYDIEIHGQIYGGVTNFTASFKLFDGTNTDTLCTLSTTTLNSNNRTFSVNATLVVTSTYLYVLSAHGIFFNAVFTRPGGAYSNTGVVVRADNPALQFTLTTLNAQGGSIDALFIERRRTSMGAIAWS